MVDKVSREIRSRTMRHVLGKNTKPELVVRSVLHRMGYRFSLGGKDLPGRPDIVLPKHQTVIFVHGCFWHRHPRCKMASTPSSNTEYWNSKFQRNVERDQEAATMLKKLGWKVLVIWECEIRKELDQVVTKLKASLGGKHVSYEIPPARSLFKDAERRAEYGSKS